jgi:DNA-nicking Smr family endonuclease
VRAPANRRAREDAEAYAALSDLVDGSGTFDIADTDEYIEGLADGVDRRLLRKLRKGDFAVQAHTDLHGLTSDEARQEVERFLDGARLSGKRCVLIVHGRGLHSKESVPVLKERLKVWLTRGRIARAVLAFATARPSDGGAGALYVLLRR